MRTVGPILVEPPAGAASQIKRLQRPSHCIEPGGKDDDVELIFFAARADASLCYSLDPTVSSGIDQENVIFVKCLVVIRVERLALGAVRIPLWYEFFGYFRVLYDLADLAFDVVGADVIRLLAEEHILVVGQPKCEPALVPHSVELALALLDSGLQNGFGDKAIFKSEERLTNTFNDLLVVGFARLDP